MPLKVYTHIDEMVLRIVQGEPALKVRLIKLYSSGVIAKLKNSEYAFYVLSTLASQLPSSTSTAAFTVSERTGFYIDSFFAFLYSVFDVIAQVINHKLNLGINESAVSFKRVKDILNQQHQGTQLQQIINTICNARFFKELEKYRNCSTHRRQIYIQSTTVQTTETPGYNATKPLPEVVHKLCDDPLTLKPTVARNLELITYCTKILNRVKKEIGKITKAL